MPGNTCHWGLNSKYAVAGMKRRDFERMPV
jgi:hypothetical protein